MPRMIEFIRASAVPSNMMQSAARGALAVPAAEMVEILVHLATHTKIFAQQASMTLAGWDEASVRAVAVDPSTPQEVLDYLISPKNLRPALLPALLENSAIPEGALMELAVAGSRETAETMLRSDRVKGSSALLEALKLNPNVLEVELDAIPALVSPDEASGSVADAENSAAAANADDATANEKEVEEVLTSYLTQHESELKAEGEKPFQPIGGVHEELISEVAPEALPFAEKSHSAPQEAATPASPKHAAAKPVERERLTTLQKIARLDITGRIQMAMKGTKEERSLLVRDGTKLVALAVLDSPKISEGEVEKIAGQKNVLEAVLRTIPMKRRFIKNYVVVRNLVCNPRTPMDVSLTLVKNLLIADLKNLAGNKEVSDTVRKMAMRLLKQKLASK